MLGAHIDTNNISLCVYILLSDRLGRMQPKIIRFWNETQTDLYAI